MSTTTKNEPDTKPPQAVADNAKKGLALRQKHNRGGTDVGVARARDLKNQRNLSERTIKKMTAYFARHEIDKEADHFGDDDKPSAGYIAWLLWGGDEGREWAQKVKKSFKKNNN